MSCILIPSIPLIILFLPLSIYYYTLGFRYIFLLSVHFTSSKVSLIAIMLWIQRFSFLSLQGVLCIMVFFSSFIFFVNKVFVYIYINIWKYYSVNFVTSCELQQN